MHKHLIAAYGTLRKGNYNHDRFPGVQYSETKRIKGFDLFDLGPYPCVIKNPEGEITVDILEVTPETKRKIDFMEIGAGYDINIIEIDEKKCTIYTYENKPRYATKINSGDYNQK